MASAGRRRRGGFWKGLIAGLAIGIAAAGAVALRYPPQWLRPPEVAPESTQPPAGPESPRTEAVPPAPGQGGLLQRPAAPIVAGRPAPDAPPPEIALPAAPDVFDGGAAGSPSLFQPEGR